MTIKEVFEVIYEHGFHAIECTKKDMEDGWYILPEKGKEIASFTDYDFRIKDTYKPKEEMKTTDELHPN